jgi:hypothetical protein
MNEHPTTPRDKAVLVLSRSSGTDVEALSSAIRMLDSWGFDSRLSLGVVDSTGLLSLSTEGNTTADLPPSPPLSLKPGSDCRHGSAVSRTDFTGMPCSVIVSLESRRRSGPTV